jgi:hypothetical protein
VREKRNHFFEELKRRRSRATELVLPSPPDSIFGVILYKTRHNMALLESIHLEHLPVDCTVHVALYESVKNAAFLQQQLLAGNSDFEYALIDASVVSFLTHIT